MNQISLHDFQAINEAYAQMNEGLMGDMWNSGKAVLRLARQVAQ